MLYASVNNKRWRSAFESGYLLLGSDHLIFMGGGGGGQEDYIGPGIFFSTETESCLFSLSAVSSWIFFFS